MIWVPIIIPVLFAIIALLFFYKKIAYWEPFIPIAATLLFIVFFKYVGVTSLTKNAEYWGNYVTEIRWYQEWDEWIEQTCTRSYPCGTDSKGNTEYCTETYDCSYRLYHPEYWSLILDDSQEITIDKAYYSYLKKKFGTKSVFNDLNRNFYHIDGDMYSNNYPNTFESFEYYATEHKYENKIQATTSVFNYPEIDSSDFKKYKLYDYPKIVNNDVQSILTPKSISIQINEQKKINYINGRLGRSKHIKIWICLYEYSTDDAGYKQEALWKRGNKNEFVICIGTNKNRDINWVHIFGWSKEKTIDIETRNYILAQKKLNLSKLGDWLYIEVQNKWTMTNFDEFNDLSIEPPTWSIITTWIVSLIACILLYIWILMNQFTPTEIQNENNDFSSTNIYFKKIKKQIKNLFIKIKINYENRFK